MTRSPGGTSDGRAAFHRRYMGGSRSPLPAFSLTAVLHPGAHLPRSAPVCTLQVLDHERIRHQFNMALDSMNSSVEGGGQASRWSAGGHSTATAAPPLPTMPPPPQSSITYATPASELTLRDLVQQFAEEHGVPFVPKFGRFHDGLQVGFDNLSRQALQRVI